MNKVEEHSCCLCHFYLFPRLKRLLIVFIHAQNMELYHTITRIYVPALHFASNDEIKGSIKKCNLGNSFMLIIWTQCNRLLYICFLVCSVRSIKYRTKRIVGMDIFELIRNTIVIAQEQKAQPRITSHPPAH